MSEDAMKTYDNTRSGELFERAASVIPGGVPGHLGPAEGCYMPIKDYPIFTAKADGAYFWDVDGNRYIDYMCAYGPNILGYNDPDVDAAAAAQAKVANCTQNPTPLLIELAELMVDTIAMADWAFFAKNGGDVTAFALMIARAATGRDKVVLTRGGYHGVAPWMQGFGSPGVTQADVSNNLYMDFGDVAQFERYVAEHRGRIAAFFSTPYHHPVFDDNRTPPEGYWQRIREICTREGIVLVIDDVRAGFRLDVAGSDAHYGFEADLTAYCKALANGHNISALCGTDALKEAAASVMYTGSYWMSAVPMAAAIACVRKMREIDSAEVCLKTGRRLTEGLVDAAATNGFDLRISGEPSMWFLRTTAMDGEPDDNYLLHQAWVAECVRRGVFFTNHHNLFINTAMSEEDLLFTFDVADAAFRSVRSRARSILTPQL
ncbi:MAG: aminotransferase class III-fold pyridoxal phosphate-dependent enzyme [Mobilicoccus sp.]|nr:aminotransferase class III-fold pyridoxal phosphate-dependent enzyme [Mobilicoccus sp.]